MASVTHGSWLSALDTVARETLASLAISLMVARFIVLPRFGGAIRRAGAGAVSKVPKVFHKNLETYRIARKIKLC